MYTLLIRRPISPTSLDGNGAEQQGGKHPRGRDDRRRFDGRSTQIVNAVLDGSVHGRRPSGGCWSKNTANNGLPIRRWIGALGVRAISATCIVADIGCRQVAEEYPRRFLLGAPVRACESEKKHKEIDTAFSGRVEERLLIPATPILCTQRLP